MATSTLLYIAGGIAGVLTLLVMMLARRRSSKNPEQSNRSSRYVPVNPDNIPSKDEDAAAKWLSERKEKLHGKLAELFSLKAKLSSSGEWSAQDERRLNAVQAEVADYLSSMAASPVECLYAYRQLFHSGPYTTVPFAPGGWSVSWGVWMVDAHIELLIRHAATRVNLASLQDEKKEREQQFLVEIESKLVAAGFDTGEQYVKRYRIEHVAREITRCRLVRFENSPFGLNFERTLDELRVADSLPDIGALADQMPSKKPEEFVRLFQDYRTAVDRSWRPLTADEKDSVLKALAGTA